MARYFELKNANHRVVVDDQYRVANFLYRSRTTGGTTEFRKWSTRDGDSFKYLGGYGLVKGSLRDFGFDMATNPESLKDVNAKIMLFVRSEASEPFRASASFSMTDDGRVAFTLSLRSDFAGIAVEFCVYTVSKMIPCKYGAQAFNAQGDLVFDAMRGYMQVVGAMHGGVNVRSDPAATYTVTIPTGLDSRNVFISQRSALPFFSAFNIHSGGVGYGQTYFFPIMSFPNSTTMVVQLRRQNYVAGDNSTTSFDGYFENAIYCPYPSDVWVSGI